MNPTTALVVVTALVAVTALVGLVWRARDGKRRDGRGDQWDAADVGERGARATLVQFSSEMCSRCPQVRRLLSQMADAHPGVVHAEVDLTHRPELASRYRILQTPTTLLIDGRGTVTARFNGVPHQSDIRAALTALPAPQEAR